MVNLLIAVTGSVASIKLPLLVNAVKERQPDISIKIVVTKNSTHFFDVNDIEDKNIQLLRDEDEWSTWKVITDDVLHIELRKWADVMVIAPLDANTLAKIAGGICDNLLTCIVRAWDIENKKLFYAPAMNTFMWNHPLTEIHCDRLKTFGYIQIEPVVKKLACGDYGCGGMASVETIVDTLFGKS
jgi:phosphopantothenoylcysteine decarboxylase